MKKTYIYTAILAAVLAASLTGCADAANSDTASVSNAQNVSSSETQDSTDVLESESDADRAVVVDAAAVSPLAYQAEQDSIFTERDLTQTADTDDAVSLTVSDGAVIDITDEGVYIISGTAAECTIRVDADDSAKIQLVLDGVSITNSDFPEIYVVSADKVFITTTNTENTLTVSGQFRADGDTNTDAVIFSKDDLVLNGTGTLNITSSFGNGITCKDDMKITGGTYNVRCALDAFEANDSISVNDGEFTIETEKDGFHCENDQAEGTITVYGGSFEIKGGSDGMQACALLEINGGTMNITGSEGLEATYIRINDGTVSIQASDDGINASTSTNACETAVEINGGYLTVAVGQGDTDAIDSNGSIYVNGGTIDITAQMSSFDYDKTAEFNGGTIIINGTEVSEIPQSMMGGGRGGMDGSMFGGRGKMNGEMPGETGGSTEGGMRGGMRGSGRGGMNGFSNGGAQEFSGNENAL